MLFPLLLPLCLLAEDVGERYLKQYEGRWTGSFTIHSEATDYKETFPVEQQYWWKDGMLRGVAVSQRESGMQSSRSRSFIEDGKIISHVETALGEATEIFLGVPKEDGLVWVSADVGRVELYQMREHFEKNEGKIILKTEGFDSYVVDGEVLRLVYEGELVRVE